MKYEDLEAAFESNSIAGFADAVAYIHKKTYELVYDDEPYSGVSCPVKDIETNGHYMPVPNKIDLNLGKNLVWEFIEKEIPEKEDEVYQIFLKKNAYGKYKELLHRHQLLENWYVFENTRKQETLRLWCEENHIQLTD